MKKLLSLLFILTLSLLMTGCEKEVLSDSLQDVVQFVDTYMEARKEGTAQAVPYMHFEDDFKRQAYMASGDKLLDYKVEGIEKINDDLYAVQFLIKTEIDIWENGDDFRQVNNFVVRIGGEWKYLNGVSHIPQSAQKNLDRDKYTVTGPNVIDVEDVICLRDVNSDKNF